MGTADGSVYVNAIATAHPPHDFQPFFLDFIPPFLTERDRPLFRRLMGRCQIDHRYTFLQLDRSAESFYRSEAEFFPSTGERMTVYQQHAPRLAHAAAEQLIHDGNREGITHVVVGSCTGFYAPGVDCDLIQSLRLPSSVQRRTIGFMGCYAGMSVLQTAHDIVRADPRARVLTVNIELSSLHLQKPVGLVDVMGSAQFADGCAAALMSAEPRGMAVGSFRARVFHEHASAITWTITDQGFAMFLDPKLPQILSEHVLPRVRHTFDEADESTPACWALHPGGRSILDAVQARWELTDDQVRFSRSVLSRFGNMSSATILFVLRDILADPKPRHGHAIAFGPGLAVESMQFRTV